MRKWEEHRDSGLESFLHLLDQELALPQVAVEPQEIRLCLDKEEKNEIFIRITNKGRGYLSGTIELSEKVPGLELLVHRFGLDSKSGNAGREISVGLRVNTNVLMSDWDYRLSMVKNTTGMSERANIKAAKSDILSLVISTNGTPERLVVPVYVLVAEARYQAEKEIKKIKSFLRVIESYGAGNTPSCIEAKDVLRQAEAFFEKASLFDYWDAINETTRANFLVEKVPSEFLSITNETKKKIESKIKMRQTNILQCINVVDSEALKWGYFVEFFLVLISAILLAEIPSVASEAGWIGIVLALIAPGFFLSVFFARVAIRIKIWKVRKEYKKLDKELCRLRFEKEELDRTVAHLEAKLRQ